MKNTLSAALIAAFAMSLTFGQRLPSIEKRALRMQIPQVEFGPARVFADPNGALISWEMTAEPNTAGYNVYEMGGWSARLVNKRMVLGSATRSGAGEIGGESYEIFDALGDYRSLYVIEAYGLDGTRSFSKQIKAKYVGDIGEAVGIAVDDLKSSQKSRNRVIESSALMLSDELQATVSSSEQPADLATHRWVVSQPAASISVRQDGLYRVSRNSLAAANFPVNSDPANWRLFLQGVEHPIIVGPNADYIEFYGRGIDTPETDTRVYYLISDSVPGRRIVSRILRSVGGNIVSPSFTMEAIKKERGSYDQNILNGEVENHWGGIVTSAVPRFQVEFDLNAIDPSSSNSTLTVKMQGFSAAGHETRVWLNGTDIGTVTGNGRNSYSREFTIPTGLLVDGGSKNLLELSSVASNDLSYFDAVAVEYPRKYIAEQNRLAFFTPGFRRVNVGGFTSANVRVFDTTHDAHPQFIANAQIISDSGTFMARLPSARPAVYYAVEDSAVLTPAAVAENKPSTLSTAGNSADLVIISHSAPDFLAASEAWADYRRAQGFAVKVVDVRDVFDEFNYGLRSWLAIKQFLQFTHENWQKAPAYVLLIGDGSRDPRNYEGNGSWDLVPTRMVDTFFTETGSDEALADFDGDGLADMAVGRIPAREASLITTALNKTSVFEADANRTERGSFFVYGGLDENNFEYISQTLNNQVSQTIPGTLLPAPTGANSSFIDALNTGKFIVNFAGHGSTGAWFRSKSADSFFNLTQDAPSLTNGNKQTIFTMLTCLNGYFIHPKNDSLSEGLLKNQNGGAVAAWSSSGLTTSDLQTVMGKRFYNQLGEGNITRLGDLIRDAKAALTAGPDVKFSWVLLGDPMLKVR